MEPFKLYKTSNPIHTQKKFILPSYTKDTDNLIWLTYNPARGIGESAHAKNRTYE